MIGPMTAILMGGQVLPIVLLGLGISLGDRRFPGWQLALSALATVAAYYPRVASAMRFRQSLLGAMLHPVGVLVLIAIQWFAFVRQALGRPSTWKGRPYPSPASAVTTVSVGGSCQG